MPWGIQYPECLQQDFWIISYIASHHLQPSILRGSPHSLLLSIFPHSQSALSIYYGHKTEIVAQSQLRNYQSHLIETEPCLVAIPGKFSLSFTLAINVCKYYRIKPALHIEKLASFNEAEKYVSFPEHYKQSIELMKEKIPNRFDDARRNL
jgi:hypothetical protein